MQRASANIVADTPASPGGATTQFVIPASTSLQELRPRTLKYGDTFAVFDHNGDALSGPGSPAGLFHRDTRYLSRLYLTVEGQRPLLLSSTLRDDNATLTCDLTNQDLFNPAGALILEHDLLHLRRSCFLWNGACYERLAVRNFDERPQRVRVDIAFAADFADLFEVRGARRARRGRMQEPAIGSDRETLAYLGLDERRRATTLRFDPAPNRLTAEQATFHFEIGPKEACALVLEIRCDGAGGGETLRRARFATRAGRCALPPHGRLRS